MGNSLEFHKENEILSKQEVILLSKEEYNNLQNKMTVLESAVEKERHEKNNALNALRQLDNYFKGGDLK